MIQRFIVKKGELSRTLLVFIGNSSVTTGAGLTGLAYDSGSLTWYYYREEAGTGATQVTLADPTLGTWLAGGFIEVDGTDMPGWYEIGIPDAALAINANFVMMQLKGAADMRATNIEIQLTELGLSEDTPLTAADIESECNDALDTAIAELGVAAPSATPTLRTAAMLMYMALRNKTDVPTSGSPDLLEIHNDAGTLIAKKQLTDAAGDYSEAQMESG